MARSILRRSMWIGQSVLLSGRLLVRSGFAWGCRRSIESFGLLFVRVPLPPNRRVKRERDD